MGRTIFLALVLAGCAMMGGSERTVLGHAVVCDASADQFCDADGRCRPMERGVRLSTPVSLSVPAGESVGQFCIATGCEAAFFFPLEARRPDWRAEVRVGESWSRPVGEITVEKVRWTFVLVQPASDGATHWTGACRAVGS